MDAFIDKLAQKISTGERMRTYSSTDERENGSWKSKTEEYDKLLQEMQSIREKNNEASEKLINVADSAKRDSEVIKSESAGIKAEIRTIKADTAVLQKELEEIKKLIADNKLQVPELVENLENSLTKTTLNVDDIADKTSDIIHKENVKVYRNVQAAVNATIEEQTKVLLDAQSENEKGGKQTFLKVMSVLIFVSVLADIALKVLGILGIL